MRWKFDGNVDAVTLLPIQRFVPFVCLAVRRSINTVCCFVPHGIAWRLHCMLRVSKRSWSSTALGVTNRSFT